MRDLMRIAMLSTAIAFGAIVSAPTAAIAATCTDPAGDGSAPSIAGLVIGDVSSSNSGCQLGSTNNDFIGGGSLQVNTDDIFGTEDCACAGKTFGDSDTGIDIGLTASGSTTGSGTGGRKQQRV